MKKRLSLSPETHSPFLKKAYAFFRPRFAANRHTRFSPIPEWLPRVAVWWWEVTRTCHLKNEPTMQNISTFQLSSCQVTRLIIVF